MSEPRYRLSLWPFILEPLIDDLRRSPMLNWLIYKARGGKGVWPFNLYRWKSDS